MAVSLSRAPTGPLQPGFLFSLIAPTGFPRAASVLAVLTGGLVLSGWSLDVAALQIFSGSAAMPADAALALVLSGLSLWLLTGGPENRSRRAARLLAAVAVLVSLLALAEHLLGRDLGVLRIPGLLSTHAADAGAHGSGRMDAATAVLFLLLGVELSMLGAALDAALVRSLALGTGAVSLIAWAGYLYGLPALYTIGPYGPVAPHAAAGLTILSLGVLYARPAAGLLAGAAGDEFGGVMAFRLLPGAVAIPLALGYLILKGQSRGLYDAPGGLALFALANAAAVAAWIVWSARSLARSSSASREEARLARRDLERMRALKESGLAIGSASGPDAVLDVLLEKAQLLIPAAAATTVRLVNGKSGELEPAAARHRSGAAPAIDENKALGGRAKKVFETQKPATIRNLQTDGQVYNQIYRKLSLVSYGGVPLVAKGEALGVLGVYTDAPHEFTGEELECLGGLAGQAALALSRNEPARASEPPKNDPAPDGERREKSPHRLPELYAALVSLNPSQPVQDAIGALTDKLLEATEADAALVRVWKKETGASLVADHRGLPDDAVKQMEVGLLGGAVDWVKQHGEAIIASEIGAEPRFKTKVQQQLGFRSSAVLPLKIHGDVRGILYIASRKPDHFAAEQQPVLAAIAYQLGVSMENRELFDHLKNSRDELERASKVKDEFLSVMSHELRTPLSVVMGYAGMVKEKMLGDINPQQEEALQKLLTRANDQLNMINAIMQITQLESRALVLERHLVNLSEMLAHLKTDYALGHAKEQVTFVWDYPDQPVTLVSDGGKLKEILANLINNAIKFTSQGSVTVSMRLTEDPQRKRWVELSVADTGVGIAKEHLAKIFDKFYQVDSSETRLYGGAGLGLYIVKHFAEFLGGKIKVASEPGKGTTFTVTIPYAT